MKKESYATRMEKAMLANKIKQTELSKKTKIPKSAISQYLSGAFEPKQDRVEIIAKALNVSEAWLMGFDVPMQRGTVSSSDEIDYEKYGLMPVKLKKLPMLGEIACGEPIYAEREYETYVEASSDIQADFCLTAKGDSMINARIFNGDIVFIRKQPDVENGEIAAVCIGDEVTLKRVFKYENRLELRPENPTHIVQNYEGEELNTILILGKAVAFQSDVR